MSLTSCFVCNLTLAAGCFTTSGHPRTGPGARACRRAIYRARLPSMSEDAESRVRRGAAHAQGAEGCPRGPPSFWGGWWGAECVSATRATLCFTTAVPHEAAPVAKPLMTPGRRACPNNPRKAGFVGAQPMRGEPEGCPLGPPSFFGGGGGRTASALRERHIAWQRIHLENFVAAFSHTDRRSPLKRPSRMPDNHHDMAPTHPTRSWP